VVITVTITVIVVVLILLLVVAVAIAMITLAVIQILVPVPLGSKHSSAHSSPVRYGCRQANKVCRCGLNIAAGLGIGFAMLDPDPIPAYPKSGGPFV
jgi:hypothetical protein